MNPLLVLEAGQKAHTPPLAAPEEKTPLDAPVFAMLVEEQVDTVVTGDEITDLALAAGDTIELPVSRDAKSPPLSAEPAAIQVVLPANAKAPAEVAADLVIDVKNPRAATALIEGKPAKALVEGTTQEVRGGREKENASALTRSLPSSVVSAQTIVVARGLAAPQVNAAPSMDGRTLPNPVVGRMPQDAEKMEPKGVSNLISTSRQALPPQPTGPSANTPQSNPASLPNPRKETDVDPRLNALDPKAPSSNAQAPVLPAAATQQTGMTNPKAFARQLEEIEKALPRSASETAQVAVTEGRTGSSVSASATTTPAAMEAARQVAHQISTAVSAAQGRATEIALNPEELGRVKMTLTASEGAVTLVLLADRPETNELLRRHIDVLAQEFRAIGYDNISFSFGSDGQSNNANNPDEQSDRENLTTPPADQQQGPLEQKSAGLDLRV